MAQPEYVLLEKFEALEKVVESQQLYNTHYQLASLASIVILMQLGFTFLEVGSVRVQFTKAILTKNMVDMILSALMYFALGFGFAYSDGSSTGGFIGTENFFLLSTGNSSDISNSAAGWLYQWSYCATATTIVGGAIAERTQLAAYGIYSVISGSILYPVVTHWVWSTTGWASMANPQSLIAPVLDDAGGIAVHAYGGIFALVACWFVGPRQHRLDEKGKLVKDLPRQNQSFIVFGMFILWFSWYAFNAAPAVMSAGSAGSDEALIGVIAAYTTVCAAASGTAYLVLAAILYKKIPDPGDLSNGILAGLISSTSGCSVIRPYFGIVIGSIGGVVVLASSKLLRKLGIDDVVDAVPVHLACGVWSAISAPFFAETTINTDPTSKFKYKTCGIFTGCDEGWKYLGSNLLVTFLTLLYVSVLLVITCLVLRSLGLLRIDVESEVKGVDVAEFDGLAYINEIHSETQDNVKENTISSV